MKKEFITTWNREEIDANLEVLPVPRAAFFDSVTDYARERIYAVVPQIPYRQLDVFQGLKTRITIEVIP